MTVHAIHHSTKQFLASIPWHISWTNKWQLWRMSTSFLLYESHNFSSFYKVTLPMWMWQATKLTDRWPSLQMSCTACIHPWIWSNKANFIVCFQKFNKEMNVYWTNILQNYYWFTVGSQASKISVIIKQVQIIILSSTFVFQPLVGQKAFPRCTFWWLSSLR